MARTQDVLDHPVTRAVTGTALVGGVVIAVSVALSALVGPLPAAEIAEPVPVDEEPGLPSDEEPADGWPVIDVGGTDSATVDDQQAGPGADAQDEADDTTDDTTEADRDEATAPDDGSLLDETVEDVADTVTDTVDTVTDTVDDATDTVDDATDAVEDATDAVEDVTDGVEDAVEDATDGVLP